MGKRVKKRGASQGEGSECRKKATREKAARKEERRQKVAQQGSWRVAYMVGSFIDLRVCLGVCGYVDMGVVR